MGVVVVSPQLRCALRGGVHSEQIRPSSCAHLNERIPPPFSCWARQLGSLKQLPSQLEHRLRSSHSGAFRWT
jgi:hypothetical protein